MAKTIIHQDLKSLWGDKDHLQVAQNTTFSDLIFELLAEKKPTPGESKIFELILNLSIDHGNETPSAIKTIETAKSGKTISESVAAGITQINDLHGGAIEPAMELFKKVESEKLKVKSLVEDCLKAGNRLPGFGHRIYKDVDPRAELILSKLKQSGLDLKYQELARSIEGGLEDQKGTKVPLNIDGAIAVVLCSFGWDARLGKAVFIIARTPGLCGWYLNSI